MYKYKQYRLTEPFNKNFSKNFIYLEGDFERVLNIKNRLQWKKVVNKMEVTDVRLRRVNTDGRMRAIASITLDNEFVVHDIRVIDGNNGLFVAMPSKRTPDGEFRDIAHPINSNTRGKIQDAVLAEYHRLGELEERELEEAGAS
jgi:stage V sporulation protein G